MREPHSLIFEGAPGWTLQTYLWIADRVREYFPDLKAYVFLTGGEPALHNDDPQVVYAHRKMFEGIRESLQKPWVVKSDGHGSAEDYAKASIWCYPTHVPEDHIESVARKAQVNGAIPIFNPIGALRDCVFAGCPIYGIPALHQMSKARYAYEIVNLFMKVDEQDTIRKGMMEFAAQIEEQLLAVA